MTGSIGTGSDFPADVPSGQGIAGAIPPLADCFTPRPQSGPGPLEAGGDGQWLTLTAPPVPVHDWAGGTGKTQLAVHLARIWRQASQAGLLIWLGAGSRESVLSGYARAAAGQSGAATAGAGAADDAETAAARFLSWLAETRQPWLVVLDGLSDPGTIEGLRPEGPSGQVLVTSGQVAAVSRTFTVGAFASHEALSYLMARLSADPDQRLGAVDLVDDLGCDPLALAQASAAIASSGVSCREYRDMFARQKEQLAATLGVEPPVKAVTWTLSVECADESSPDGGAQLCLALASLLGSQGIPGPVFSTPAVARFLAESAGGAADSGRVHTTLRALENVGLLSIDPSGAPRMIRVHPAVCAAAAAAMPGSLREQAAVAAASALLQAWPEDDERSTLACGLRACTTSLELAAADLLWAGKSHQVLFRAGQSLDDARLTGPAVSHWRAVAGTSEKVLGPAHPDAMLAAARLASAAMAAGHGADAVGYYQRAVDTKARMLGPDHPQTLSARANLGEALLAAGQPDEAIGVLEEVLRRPGADAFAVQDSLVAAYQATGRQADAVRIAERALSEREHALGQDHPQTMLARRNVARACLAAGRGKDAVSHGSRAMAGSERVLGADHPDTIEAVSVLASAYHSTRRLKDAITLYERALRDAEQVHGPDDPLVIGVRGNLASAYHSAGRMASALELYERTRADSQRVLGPDHPDTLAARANLAHAYYAMGRLTEATTLLRGTLADCERALVPGDPLTAAVRDSLEAVSRG